MSEDIIQVKIIGDNLYLLNENINEDAFITMMLVIGDEKAVIMDTGMGVSGDLDEVIEISLPA